MVSVQMRRTAKLRFRARVRVKVEDNDNNSDGQLLECFWMNVCGLVS